jgi:hypothetical protein
MTTLTVTLDFSSDDGTAENFVAVYSSGSVWPDGSYDGSQGNPSGSVTSTATYPTHGGLTLLGWAQTLENWGVPAGATINSVGNLTAEYRAHISGYSADNYPVVSIRKGTTIVGGTVIAANYPSDPYTGVFDTWASLPQQDIADLSPYTTSTVVRVELYLDGTPTSGGTLQYWYDNITFDIDYTAGADVEIDGSSTLAGLSGSGTATFSGFVGRGASTLAGLTPSDGTITFTDVDVRLIGSVAIAGLTGTGGLSLDGEIIVYGSSIFPGIYSSGVIFIELTGEEAAPAPSGTQFVLTLDGAEYALLEGVVTKASALEMATATLPRAIVAAILASPPTTMTITMNRQLLDGSGTDSATLFTGTIAIGLTTLVGDFGKLTAAGLASYPARANRQLEGSPSYVRDSAESTSVRGRINPDMVPGDVLRFSGAREIQASKVVFNLSPDLYFMEASNGIG